MSHLFVRCCLKSGASSKLSSTAAQWGLKSSEGTVKLLPASLTISEIHKMEWKAILSSVTEEVSSRNVSMRPLYDERPDKVIGIGLNYKDHMEEQNMPPEKQPKEPVIFNKVPFSTHFYAILYNNDCLYFKSSRYFLTSVDSELEIDEQIWVKLLSILI